MCDHHPREPSMTVISKTVWCDPCLAPLIKALNDGGIPTVASCCGHGKRLGSITLADGRWLVMAPSAEAATDLAASPAAIAGVDAPEVHHPRNWVAEYDREMRRRLSSAGKEARLP